MANPQDTLDEIEKMRSIDPYNIDSVNSSPVIPVADQDSKNSRNTNATFTNTVRTQMTMNDSRLSTGASVTHNGRIVRQAWDKDVIKSAFRVGSLKPDGLIYGHFNPVSNAALSILNNDVDTSNNSDWIHFDRWYSIDLNKEDISGRHYIFICRPDLNLVTEGTNKLNAASGIASDGFFQYLASYYPHIITSLTGEFDVTMGHGKISQSDRGCGSGLGNATQYSSAKDSMGNSLPIHTFIPVLTGRAESLQLPDMTIKNYELTQPYTKYTIPYAASAIESQTGGTFDIVFREDQDFSIHKLFYAWIYYTDGVMRNRFRPKDKYIIYNAFDYATSIYDIAVDATGENIIWFAKYTGCFPLTSPTSNLSFNLHSSPDPRATIPFAYFFCEQNNLWSLLDFNYNSLGYVYMKKINSSMSEKMNPKVPVEAIYNQTVNYSKAFLGRSQVGRPVVFMNAAKRILKLRWMPYSAS